MFWAVLVHVAALPLVAVAFKWLINVFEGDNPRNVRRNAVAATAITAAASYGWAWATDGWSSAAQAATTLAVVLAVSVGVVWGLYRVGIRRGAALGMGLPVAWGLALCSAALSRATLEQMLRASPVATLFALAVGVWAVVSVRRRDAHIAARFRRITSWITA